MSTRVGVAGASGYAGGELLRILLGHPEFDLELAGASNYAGSPITDVHPGLLPLADTAFASVTADMLAEMDLVFIALPHGMSAELTDQLPGSVTVVDLGADHRLADPAQWSRYYGDTAAAKPWVYGLPELPNRREAIAQASRVASPGCYATALQLSLAPLLAAGLAEPTDIVAVAASGTSGAGRKTTPSLLASEVMGAMTAYKVGGSHPHTAEVEQELSALSNQPVTLSFTPLLAPMPRGIIATSTARLAAGIKVEDVREAFAVAYAKEPFVHLLAPGRSPTTAATLGSSSALLQVEIDQHAGRVVVIAAIDNLGKGAAGQAVQNANLMLGLDETLGLPMTGVAP